MASTVGEAIEIPLSVENTFPLAPRVSKQRSLQKSATTEGFEAPLCPSRPLEQASQSIILIPVFTARLSPGRPPFTQVLRGLCPTTAEEDQTAAGSQDALVPQLAPLPHVSLRSCFRQIHLQETRRVRLSVGGKDKKTVFSIPGKGVFGTRGHVARLVGCKSSAAVCACCMRACVYVYTGPALGHGARLSPEGVEPAPPPHVRSGRCACSCRCGTCPSAVRE